MKTIEEVKMYPSNLELITTDEAIIDVPLDGTKGEFSRNEWKESEDFLQFDAESVEIILNKLDAHDWFA
jgi:hypothetical protein